MIWFNTGSDSEKDYDVLVAEKLEIGTEFEMIYLSLSGPSAEYLTGKAIYEGLADDEETKSLLEGGQLNTLVMDVNREQHHLVWLEDDEGNVTLWVNDFVYLSLLDKLPEITANPIPEA